MTRLDDEYRNAKNGMIGYDHYRCLATNLRREARSNMMKAAWSALAARFTLPRKRQMRRQASSRSAFLVA